MNKSRYFMVSAIVLVALIGYFGFYNNLINLHSQLVNLNDDNLDVAGEGLARQFSQVEEDLMIVTQTEPVLRMEPKRLKALFTRIAKTGPGFLNMIVLNSQGKVIQAMVGNPSQYKLSDNQGVRTALSGQMNLSNLIYAKTNRTWIVSLKIPVYSDDSKVIGVALATLSLDHLQQDTKSYPFQNGAYAVLMDGAGNIIYHPGSDEQKNVRLRQTLFPRLKGKPAGDFTIVSPVTGKTTLYKFERLGNYNWYLLMAQPMEQIYYVLAIESLKVVGALTLSLILLNLLLKYSKLEKKRAQAEIENRLGKLEVVGQIAAGVAHEIRNPLTTLKGFLQLMAMKREDPQDLEYFDIMLKEIKQIEHISQEFLSLAKPTAPVLVPCDLNKLVLDISNIMLNKAFPSDMVFEKELSPTPPMVMADSGQLRQVASNLIKNAIDACQKEGRLLLRTAIIADKAIFQVIDNGSGFTDEIKEKLGTPFFTTKETGTGLGLTVCLRIVQSLGGEMELDSEPSRGTTVTVSLPYVKQ